jgi:hypothetical protein
MHQNRGDCEWSGADNNTLETMPQEEHCRKRHKKDDETTGVSNYAIMHEA